ncbi:MAG: ABC transporter ATP-binding protein [Verrucomicrobia bacterium]|nr:ABC transporter ATP-binding protein [Verrucomicrobiota bacterium]
MNSVIHAHELSRWYGIVMGLNHVTFDVPAGLTGLVGPNGAGKSTLIQLITGQLRPSSGELRVLEARPWNNPALMARIGYCPEGEAVPKDLHALDWLVALARLSGLDAATARRRAGEALARVRLARSNWNRPLAEFSKGMRQRAKLAQALLHDPELLVLDEPMNGLDPMGRQEIAQILRGLAQAGKSILISSHILAELEALCRNFLILNWGRVLASGSRKEIRQDLSQWSEQLLIRCDDPERLARHLFEAGLLLGFELRPERNQLEIRIRDPRSFYATWPDHLLRSGVAVHEIRSESRSLRQIFEHMTS